MNGITQDPTSKRWKLEAGASVVEMYVGMYEQGNVTIPAASCTTVGLGGHIAGGAYGFLDRLLGIGPDWVSAVDIVTVDGKGKVSTAARRQEERSRSPPRLPRIRRRKLRHHHRLLLRQASPRAQGGPSGRIGFDWAGMTPGAPPPHPLALQQLLRYPRPRRRHLRPLHHHEPCAGRCGDEGPPNRRYVGHVHQPRRHRRRNQSPRRILRRIRRVQAGLRARPPSQHPRAPIIFPTPADTSRSSAWHAQRSQTFVDRLHRSEPRPRLLRRR